MLESAAGDRQSVSQTPLPDPVKVAVACIKLSAHTSSPKPSEVHILTHIIRRGPKDNEGPKGPAPLYGVHVDQSFNAAEGVAQRWLGDRAADLLKKPRYQIINVRPIIN